MKVLKFNENATATEIGDALLEETIGSEEDVVAEITEEQGAALLAEYDCTSDDEDYYGEEDEENE